MKYNLASSLKWFSSLTPEENKKVMQKRFLSHVQSRKLSNQQIKKLCNDFKDLEN